MPKKVINDIIINKKSIRDIPISTTKKVAPKSEVRKKEPVVYIKRKPLNPKFAIWLIAIIALLALFFGVSLVFTSATLTITPRVEKISFNNEIYPLSSESLKVDKVNSQSVEATEEKNVNQKASGKIVIYNNYSAVSQRLINNTRFESSDGRIYRLASSVDVPGTKVVSGKTVPGSIEATVYADEPGDKFNMKLADLSGDFKVPGFKGTPRYNSFYARLKTDIAGGLIGKQKIVSPAVRKETEEKIKATLKEDLLKEFYSIKPDNYIIFNNSYTIDYVTEQDTVEDSGEVKISIAGHLNGTVFNSLKVANIIATKKGVTFDGLQISFIPDENLQASIVKEGVKLTGEGEIKWIYNQDQIRKDLVGQPASALIQILSKYKEQVETIKVTFKPVWTRYFPDNINRIKVIELDE